MASLWLIKLDGLKNDGHERGCGQQLMGKYYLFNTYNEQYEKVIASAGEDKNKDKRGGASYKTGSRVGVLDLEYLRWGCLAASGASRGSFTPTRTAGGVRERFSTFRADRWSVAQSVSVCVQWSH